MKKQMQEFFDYMKKSVSPYHAVAQGIELLEKEGFTELAMTAPFELKKGGKYYVRPYHTTLFAFTVGKQWKAGQDFHVAAAHTDFPCLHVKAVAELPQKGYLRVNTEIYGGPILNTWLDRPLSLAGRVALRSEDAYHPNMVLYNAKKPVLTIPNLAIHMNREVNKGVELKKQSDMLPLLGLVDEKLNDKQYFVSFLAKQLKVKKEDILDFDLYIYNTEEGVLVGMKEEFYSCPRLDNLTSCYALLKGLIDGKRAEGINLIALYDNEEIGSGTKQGADSALMTMLMEKIFAALGQDKAALDEAVLRSFLFSVDVAHALHPNHPEKYDAENFAKMNDGVVFKINANQRYTFDTEAIAIAQMLCEKSGAKFRKFVNHADIAGGGTLGPIISSWLPMKTVDIGVPLLAMHSARELMGIEDEQHLITLMTEFFNA